MECRNFTRRPCINRATCTNPFLCDALSMQQDTDEEIDPNPADPFSAFWFLVSILAVVVLACLGIFGASNWPQLVAAFGR